MKNRRIACPKCKAEGRDSRDDHLRPWEDGRGGWCFHGHGVVKFDEGDAPITTRTSEQPLDVAIIATYPIRAIESRGISKATCERYEVRTEVNPMDGTQESVLYPFYSADQVVGYKRRRLPKSFSVIGKTKGLFGQKQCKQNARFLIVVEGEQDVLAGWEMLSQRGKDWNIVSLPNGANEEGTLDAATLREIEWIVKHDKVLLMLDNDEPGRRTAKTLAETLASQTTVGVATFPKTLKDTSDCWENDLVDDWFRTMNNAVIYRPEAIVEGKDIILEDLRQPKEPGIPLPYPKLQKQTWGVRKGEITLLTAGCVDADTEFLSQNGWKRIADYSVGDEVANYLENGRILFHEPIKYIKDECQSLTRFHTRYGVDQALSDEHTVVYQSGGKKIINKISFSDLKKRHDDSRDGWQGKFITTFDYDGVGIDLDEGSLRLQVAVMADGRIVEGGKDNYTQMRFRKKRKYDRLINLCLQFGLPFRDMTKEGGDYEVIVWPTTKEKEYTERYYKCSKEQIITILDEMKYWDGDENGNFFSRSKASIDFIQFAYASIGVRSTINIDCRMGKYTDGFSASVSPCRNANVGITNRHAKVKMEPYETVDGYKYCFTTHSGMWVARRNGKIFITGNSGIGKTTFAREVGYHLLDKGFTVAFIALETQMEDVARSLIAMDNNVPAHQLIFNPNCIDDEAYESSYNKLIKSNKTHFFRHWGSLDCDTLKSKMMYFAKALKVDFIILDHVSMIIAGNDSSDERKDIDMLFETMTKIVVETGVGIIPIIHLKRVQGKRFNRGDEVELTDLRGSAGAEQMSFNVWALERDQQGDEKDIVRLRNLKNRVLGFTGPADTLRYDHVTGRLQLFEIEEFQREQDG